MKKLPKHLEWTPLVLLGAVLSLATAPAVDAEALVLSVAAIEGNAGGRVTVPVTVEEARELGPVQFVLTYDPAVLRPLDVEPGALAGAAMVHDELPQPGTLRVALLTQGAIRGAGSLVDVTFEVLAPRTSCRLELEHARAWEWRTLTELLVDTRAGTFTSAGRGWSPALVLGAAALGLALLGILFTARRRRRTALAPAGA